MFKKELIRLYMVCDFLPENFVVNNRMASFQANETGNYERQYPINIIKKVPMNLEKEFSKLKKYSQIMCVSDANTEEEERQWCVEYLTDGLLK